MSDPDFLFQSCRSQYTSGSRVQPDSGPPRYKAPYAPQANDPNRGSYELLLSSLPPHAHGRHLALRRAHSRLAGDVGNSEGNSEPRTHDAHGASPAPLVRMGRSPQPQSPAPRSIRSSWSGQPVAFSFGLRLPLRVGRAPLRCRHGSFLATLVQDVHVEMRPHIRQERWRALGAGTAGGMLRFLEGRGPPLPKESVLR